MKIDSARYENGELILSCPPSDGRSFCYKFKAGEYELKRAKAKRSLDANAYAWKLINLIAEAVKESAEDVYRREVKEIPNTYEWILIADDAVESMRQLWCGGHLGRRIETDTSTMTGFVNLYLYYGSSDYSTSQMSRLIDNLVNEAHNLGLETRPQAEIDSLLEAWNGKSK